MSSELFAAALSKMKSVIRKAPTVALEPLAPLAATKKRLIRKPVADEEEEIKLPGAGRDDAMRDAYLADYRAKKAAYKAKKAEEAKPVVEAPKAVGGAGAPPVEAKASLIPEALKAKLRDDYFLRDAFRAKAFGSTSNIDKAIQRIEQVLAGKASPLKEASERQGRPAYYLGDIHYSDDPRQRTPAATTKLIEEICGSGWDVREIDTAKEDFGIPFDLESDDNTKAIVALLGKETYEWSLDEKQVKWVKNYMKHTPHDAVMIISPDMPFRMEVFKKLFTPKKGITEAEARGKFPYKTTFLYYNSLKQTIVATDEPGYHIY